MLFFSCLYEKMDASHKFKECSRISMSMYLLNYRNQWPAIYDQTEIPEKGIKLIYLAMPSQPVLRII
jgi:hypothetical protein